MSESKQEEVAHLPAVCAAGHDFLDTSIALGMGCDVAVLNQPGRPCPECDAPSKLVDGKYVGTMVEGVPTAVKDLVTVESLVQQQNAMLQRMNQRAAQQAAVRHRQQ